MQNVLKLRKTKSPMPQRSLQHGAPEYVVFLLGLAVQPVSDCFDLISVVEGRHMLSGLGVA